MLPIFTLGLLAVTSAAKDVSVKFDLRDIMARAADAKADSVGFDVYKAAEVMIRKAGQSWEWGTSAEALLELYNPELSVFSANAFPDGKIPRADPDTLALKYARQFINTNSDVFTGNSAAGDPASLGVSALLLGQSASKYIDASNRQGDYLLKTVPKYSNGAISHRPDVAELWADNVAMSFPFLAYLAVQRNDVSLMSETVRQIGLYRDVLKGGDLNWRHIIGPQSQDEGLWSTGNGWAIFGMVRVLHTLQKWPSSSNALQSQSGQLKQWIKEILDGAMLSGAQDGLLHNYLNQGDWFGEISGTALLSAMAYRMAVNDPGMFGQKYISWADGYRKAVGRHQGGDGVFSPAVDPYDWHSRTEYRSGSAEGQAFTVLLYAAYRDCVGANVCEPPAKPTTVSHPGIGPYEILTVLNAPISRITFTSMPDPTGTVCGSVQSCDDDGCDGGYLGDVKYPTCRGGSKKGCRCKATDRTCGNMASCADHGCNGSFNGLGNVAYPVCTGNFEGCKCKPTDDTCGPRQSCEKNDCHGSFNGLGNVEYAQCTVNFKGCKCEPDLTTTCGDHAWCDQNGCNGSFDGLGNVRWGKCTGNFKGCDCKAVPATCGPRQSCEKNGCHGSFNGLGNVAYAKCTGNFEGCECEPDLTTTCGEHAWCDQNGCNGSFDGLGNVRWGKCTGNFKGCDCKAVPATCGPRQSCEKNGCHGSFDGLGNVPFATCRGNFEGCECEPDLTATCGQHASCDDNGCDGSFDGLGNVGFAKCRGNFRGCDCKATERTCGSPQSCGMNRCDGSFDGLGNVRYATCRTNFRDCRCIADRGTCGPPQPCDKNGCDGRARSDGKSYCTGNFLGCECNGPQPTKPPQTPENPHGTNLWINSGCVLVNGSPRCNGDAGHISAVYQSFYHVDANQGDYSTATILARFDTNQWYASELPPGCQLNARWPRWYGDVFFGADNCLYDASGNRIDNQCCGTPDSSHSGSTINPWRDPRPAGSCQRTPFGVGVHFEVYIKGWVTDGGARLWKEVGGCGALTDKKFGWNHDIEVDGSFANIGSYQAEYLMGFNLPLTFKTGCVGRAMVSAGAPAGSYC